MSRRGSVQNRAVAIERQCPRTPTPNNILRIVDQGGLRKYTHISIIRIIIMEEASLKRLERLKKFELGIPVSDPDRAKSRPEGHKVETTETRALKLLAEDTFVPAVGPPEEALSLKRPNADLSAEYQRRTADLEARRRAKIAEIVSQRLEAELAEPDE